MNAATAANRAWITAERFAEMLDVSRHRVAGLAKAANVRTRQLPDVSRVEYLRSDVEALALVYNPTRALA